MRNLRPKDQTIPLARATITSPASPSRTRRREAPGFAGFTTASASGRIAGGVADRAISAEGAVWCAGVAPSAGSDGALVAGTAGADSLAWDAGDVGPW